MMTISYEYEGALYVNLTNRCDCACVFCLRHNGHKGSIYADNLWLEHEPTRQEALDNLLARDFSQYRELVFCGFGEPMYRTDDIVWMVDELKKRVGADRAVVFGGSGGDAPLLEAADSGYAPDGADGEVVAACAHRFAAGEGAALKVAEGLFAKKRKQ